MVRLVLLWSRINICDLFFLIILLELIFYVFALGRQWHHIIILVILLEFFRIKGFLFIVVFPSVRLHSRVLFFYVVLIVCEAGLGLSLVSSLVRGGGGVFIY